MNEEKDISKLEAEIDRLKKLVYHDELTGLLNRRGFKEETEVVSKSLTYKQQSQERRHSTLLPFTVVFFDVDNFKKVNDTYGHDAGDKVLVNVGKTLKNKLRSNDICARWGGEEFTALLLGADIEIAKRVAESLRREIEELAIPVNGTEIKVTISLGLVEHLNEENLDEILDKADKMMYEAKQNGKNRIEVFLRS